MGLRARVRGLDEMFGKRVDVPRIRHGSRQILETLINEETLLLAKYLRGEKRAWVPRVAARASVESVHRPQRVWGNVKRT